MTGLDPSDAARDALGPQTGGVDDDALDPASSLDAATVAPDEITGPRALMHATNVPHERAPVLEAAFERLVLSLKSSLREFASDDVEVALADVTSTRFGAYLASVPTPTMLAIVKADGWGGPCIVTTGGPLVFALVETVLGGRAAGGAAISGEERGFTSIETGIARRLLNAILSNAEAAFATIAPVKFAVELVETSPRFAMIAPPNALTALARFRVDIGGVPGEFEIAIPHATLEPVRDVLLANYSGEKDGRDEAWGTHLAAQAGLSETRLSAVLYEGRMPLGTIMKLAVGETLMFTTKPDDPIDLRCDSVVLARGRLGRVGNNIAVRVEHLQSMTS